MDAHAKAGLAIAAAATVALGFSVDPAYATTLWSVTGNTNSDGSFTATLNPTTPVTLTDSTTNSQLSCTSGMLSGTWPDGTGESDPIADVNSGTWTCSGPLGIAFTVSLDSTLSIGAEAANGAGGVSGAISGTPVLSASSTGCTATLVVRGYNPPVTYDNQGTLTLGSAAGSPFTVSNVNGCLGLVNNGDTGTWSDGGAAYGIAPSTIQVQPAD